MSVNNININALVVIVTFVLSDWGIDIEMDGPRCHNAIIWGTHHHRFCEVVRPHVKCAYLPTEDCWIAINRAHNPIREYSLRTGCQGSEVCNGLEAHCLMGTCLMIQQWWPSQPYFNIPMRVERWQLHRLDGVGFRPGLRVECRVQMQHHPSIIQPEVTSYLMY